MNSTTRRFSVKEICVILKACQDAGANYFQYGLLSVTFSDQKKPTPEEFAPVLLTEEAELSSKSQARESIEQDRYATKQDLIAQLAIENPVEFERLQALGEIDEGT